MSAWSRVRERLSPERAAEDLKRRYDADVAAEAAQTALSEETRERLIAEVVGVIKRLRTRADYWQTRYELLVASFAHPAENAPELIYQLQESTHERDGLSCLVLTARSLEAAKVLADKRAGRFAAGAKPWHLDGTLTSPQRLPWSREVPGLGWQHITPDDLHGGTA